MRRENLFCPLCKKWISDNLDFERLLCEKSSLTVDEFCELSLETWTLIMYEIADKNYGTIYNNDLETLKGYVKILNDENNVPFDLANACDSGNLDLIKIVIEQIEFLGSYIMSY